MYFGEAISRIDDKGRITVPRRMRETMTVMGHAIWYLTRGFDRSVFMIHRDAWNKIRGHVGRLSPMNAQAVDFRRLFFSGVAEVKPDPQGRIPVPPHLREYAGLDKEAVLIGVDDHLELWSKEAWTNFQAAKEAEYKGMATRIFAGDEDLGPTDPEPWGGEP